MKRKEKLFLAGIVLVIAAVIIWKWWIWANEEEAKSKETVVSESTVEKEEKNYNFICSWLCEYCGNAIAPESRYHNFHVYICPSCQHVEMIDKVQAFYDATLKWKSQDLSFQGYELDPAAFLDGENGFSHEILKIDSLKQDLGTILSSELEDFEKDSTRASWLITDMFSYQGMDVDVMISYVDKSLCYESFDIKVGDQYAADWYKEISEKMIEAYGEPEEKTSFEEEIKYIDNKLCRIDTMTWKTEKEGVPMLLELVRWNDKISIICTEIR